MQRKVTDILTIDELNLLQEVIETQDDNESHDVLISDISKLMLNILERSEDIALVIYNQQEEFRFPLYLYRDGYHDELKELGPPEIIDHKGNEGRYWRLADPKGLNIFDKKGNKLLGAVVNISISGLFMQCSPQQFKLFGLNMQEGDNLSFYLQIPDRGFHFVRANLVRIETEKNRHKRLALNFDINNKLALILHNYIIEKHNLNDITHL